jgi:hypothetical protein
MFVLFPAAYFILIGAGETAFARYIIPIVPFLCLAAARVTVLAAAWIARRAGRALSPAAIAWPLAAILAAPSAWSAAQTDRLLARTDNRLVAADWLGAAFGDGATIYQTGSIYGHVQMQTASPRAAAGFRDVVFDEADGTFRDAGGSQIDPPDVIVVQECPLPVYCRVPDAIRQRLDADYRVAHTLPAVDASRAGLAYDRDDAFFVPLAGFHAVTRPGPNLVVHVRKDRR